MENILPDRRFALHLLKDLDVPLHIREHSIKVSEKAIDIAKKITKVNVDINLVEIGALLHDVGRSRTHGLNHGYIGGKILKNKGLPDRLVRICETHVLGGLEEADVEKYLDLSPREQIKDLTPRTIEEKIVSLADKYFKGAREVSLRQRFNVWFRKYGRTDLLIKSKERVQKIQKEIRSVM